jgi:2C-methyl-D-erythritol 2,4-cyclodiphosphate synthase
MKTPLILAGVLALAIGTPATPGIAQTTDQRAAILAVTDSALAAINRGDMAMLTELMIPGAFTMPVRDSTRYTVRSRDEVRSRR